MNDTPPNDALSVLLLDVGQGDGTLVLLPDDRAIVFDCRDDDVVEKHLVAFGVVQLAAVVFSHLDWDHIAGGKQLLAAWHDRVSTVFLAPDGRALDDDIPENVTAKALIDYVTRPSAPWQVRTPEAGVRIASGPGWRVGLLAPSHRRTLRDVRAGRTGDANEHSAVLEVAVEDGMGGEHRLLVGADAPLVAWAELTDAETRASVFRTPHHGGALSDGGVPEGWSAARLYDRVGMAQAVLSVGTNNTDDHPTPEWCAPLAQRPGCLVRCTQVTERCQPGAKVDACDLRADVLALRGRAEPAWRHLTATGRVSRDQSRREVPCAGTVAVRLAAAGVRVTPTPDRHAAVVGGWRQPWCRDGFKATAPADAPVEEDATLETLLDGLYDHG